MTGIAILGLAEGCAPCNDLKAKLREKEIGFTFYELKDNHLDAVKGMISEMTDKGIRTVPAVWVNGVFIGGRDETVQELGL